MPGAIATSITTSGLVYTGSCYLHEFYIEAGSVVATAELANAVASAGTRWIGIRAQASSERSRSFPNGVYFPTGIYSTSSGTGARIEIVISRA